MSTITRVNHTIPAWAQIKEAKVGFRPGETYTNKYGEEKIKWIRWGYFIQLESGEIWRTTDRWNTWTREVPGVEKTDFFGNPSGEYTEPKKSRIGDADELDHWCQKNNRPWMIEVLVEGCQLAEEKQAEKLAASRA
jgi:hypothetical protein